MNLWQMIVKEILFRKTGFLLGLGSVTVAIAGMVGAVTLISAHDVRTDQILRERERETRVRMQELEDAYRVIMRDMGYNVMIFSGDQDLTRLRALGHPDQTMPYEYVERLARGHIETLNHLLPVLQQRVEWAEYDLQVILSGSPGQVPVYHLTRFLTADGEAYKNPIMAPIPEGQMILGHSVAREAGLREGDSVTLMGETFRVSRVNAAEGTTDDIAVWVSLNAAQRMLGVEGQISVIFALECVCEADALGVIEAEVNSLLPDVQVMEFSSRVVARARARQRAEEEARLAIVAERDHRDAVAAEQAMFATILVPVVMAGAAVWIFFLILGNVRERKTEIGILRAVGVRETKIVAVFLYKAVAMGLVGAFLGYAGGLAVGALWGGVGLWTTDFVHLVSLRMLLTAVVVAPALCAVAALVPALKAAQQDPAMVLRDE